MLLPIGLKTSTQSFLIKLPCIGESIASLARVGANIIFLMGVVTALIIAVINICFCYLVILIIGNSHLLSLFLGGRKYS